MTEDWPLIQNQWAAWSQNEIAMLYVLDDEAIARMIGRTKEAVKNKRKSLNIERIHVRTPDESGPRTPSSHASQRQAIVMIEHAAMQAIWASEHSMIPDAYRVAANRFADELLGLRSGVRG